MRRKRTGKDALDIEILRAYMSGTFQPGNKNRYTRARDVLRHMPEYAPFNWRGNWDEYEKNMKEKPEEYNRLLLRAMNTQLPKEKYIILKDYNGQTVYLWKFTRSGCRWTYEKPQARIFRYQKDAENLHRNYYNADNWQVERIK